MVVNHEKLKELEKSMGKKIEDLTEVERINLFESIVFYPFNNLKIYRKIRKNKGVRMILGFFVGFISVCALTCLFGFLYSIVFKD